MMIQVMLKNHLIKEVKIIYLLNYVFLEKAKNKLKVIDNSKDEYCSTNKFNEDHDYIESRLNTKNLSKDNFNKSKHNSNDLLIFKNSKLGAISNTENLNEVKGFIGNKLEKSKQEEVKFKIKNIENKKVKAIDTGLVLTNFKNSL
jgi:hypothetical protein